MGKEKCGYLGCISGWFGALRGPPGSQMVDLGCQDTHWVGGNDRGVLDEILLPDSLILATLSMDKGKCGYLGCISGWFGPLKENPMVPDGRLRVSGYGPGR